MVYTSVNEARLVSIKHTGDGRRDTYYWNTQIHDVVSMCRWRKLCSGALRRKFVCKHTVDISPFNTTADVYVRFIYLLRYPTQLPWNRTQPKNSILAVRRHETQGSGREADLC